MCYHTSTPKKGDLIEYLGPEFSVGNYLFYYHTSGFEFPQLPVITNDAPTHVAPVRWGLIPSWVKDDIQAKDLAMKTLNAKCETVFDLPSFRVSKYQRCLIFVSGFFEWEHIGKVTKPWFIYARHPLALGGVWTDWTNKETAEVIRTCSIITTPANDLMARIHNTKKRMPLIVERQNWDQWLDRQAERPALEALMQPLPDGELLAHPISKLITSRTADSNVPEVQQEYKEGLF